MDLELDRILKKERKMEALKCKMCGGNIVVVDNQAYGTCAYCGTTSTLPSALDEQKVLRFNRANHFRRQNDFDKAIKAYEELLVLDSTSAEAYWGLVLSRYGIEYVEDPNSGNRIPTCHRLQNNSVLQDADYISALENAVDDYTRSIYEEDAYAIEEIRKGILNISVAEEPYDVFICYKETSEDGRRTEDSVIAQDIYGYLIKEGFRVFFSRITLEKKLGQQFEPYIFSALNTAKVMLVVGTKSEYFNSVWVKNEWSRFLSLQRSDSGKILIPCYKGVDVYDLPEELSIFQSQDMNKIGFIQDLVHGVKKVVRTNSELIHKEISSKREAASLERLLQNATTYLMLDDYIASEGVYDKVTKDYPEDYRGWWGLIV